METWRFIPASPGSPSRNMAIDEAILEAHSQGLVPPTVRFYTWSPATLSIGYFQKAHREIDFERLQANQFGFVRRPTGGRAVLHDQELTYSVIVKEDHPFMPTSVNESYRVLSQGLSCGFQNLGLQADMVSLSDESEKEKFATLGSAACFDSPSWYELVVEGRKLVGSAQTRSRGVILQHGSVLIQLDTDLLFDVLHFDNERVRERLKASFKTRATALSDLLHPLPNFSTIEQAFAKGFAEGLHVKLEEGILTSFEQKLAKEYEESKYGTDEWNYRR